jgi:hypothetical protein
MPGNMSPRSDKNNGTSSGENLERFMSLKVLSNKMDSGSVGFSFLELAAVRRTDKIFRNPKS